MKHNGKIVMVQSSMQGHPSEASLRFCSRSMNVVMEEWLRDNEDGYSPASWSASQQQTAGPRPAFKFGRRAR